MAAAKAASKGVEGAGKPIDPVLAWLEDTAETIPPPGSGGSSSTAVPAIIGDSTDGDGTHGDTTSMASGTRARTPPEYGRAGRDMNGKGGDKLGNALSQLMDYLMQGLHAHAARMPMEESRMHEDVSARIRWLSEELALYIPGIRPWGV